MSSDTNTSDEHRENARTDDSNTIDDSKLVIEFNIPVDGFVLADTLQAHPDRIVEFEQFIPTDGQILPYLWATNGTDETAFEEAIETDPTVANCHRVATLDDGALYHLDWADSENDLLWWLQNRDATLLQSEGQDDEWHIKLRVESRDALGNFQQYCRDHDIRFELVRLYELTDPKMGQFNVSQKQREMLITALEMGYFEIPRGATLEDLADAVGISKRAASERLRRGHTNLVSNTLTIGRPTGIGVGSA